MSLTVVVDVDIVSAALAADGVVTVRVTTVSCPPAVSWTTAVAAAAPSTAASAMPGERAQQLHGGSLQSGSCPGCVPAAILGGTRAAPGSSM